MQHPKTRGGTTGAVTKPKNPGPKSADHRWQRAPTTEKKHANKTSELEAQLARLQEELNNTKNQLSQSQSSTKQARQEAEQAKKELAAMNAKLDELWACEESKIQELRKISQDRDRAWESELQAVQKHLATAIAENQKLNIRLQSVNTAESEATLAKQEVVTLKSKLSETVNTVEELKNELHESKEAETRALEQLAANGEMESELRRLKVQMEQWRKAAEVAAAMVLDPIESVDVNVVGEKAVLTGLDDAEDELAIKKTNNVLRKIGVLLKKGQK